MWFLVAQLCAAHPLTTWPTQCWDVQREGPYATYEECVDATRVKRTAWRREDWQRLMCRKGKV